MKGYPATLKCPYCGFKNTLRFEETIQEGLYWCDQDSGGCDKQFAYKVEAEVENKVKVARLSFKSN